MCIKMTIKLQLKKMQKLPIENGEMKNEAYNEPNESHLEAVSALAGFVSW